MATTPKQAAAPAPSLTPSHNPIHRARDLLAQGKPAEALDVLAAGHESGAAADNARAVCLLRLGRPEEAARLLVRLVLPGDTVLVPEGTPTVQQLNYATAQLMLGHIVAGRALLGQIVDVRHPAVARVRAGLRKWTRTLPLWRRFLLRIGIEPGRAMTFDFPPGDL